MDNPRPDKVAKVDEIAEKLESAGTVVVTEYRGLDVPAQAALRQAIKDAGGEFKIYKNTLTKIAADRTGVDLGENLTGPTALAFAMPNESGQSDPVALTKALTDFSNSNNALVIKGGVMDGDVLDTAQIDALSKVPPREEMLAKFAGLLQAPMAKFAGLLQAMPRDMAGLLKALIDKGGAGPADDGAAADAAAAADEAPADEAASDEAASDDTETDAADAPAAEAAADDAADAPEAEAASEEETDAPAESEADDTDNNEED